MDCNEIWIVGDTRTKALLDSSLNLLAGARELAEKISQVPQDRTPNDDKPAFNRKSYNRNSYNRNSYNKTSSFKEETGVVFIIISDGTGGVGENQGAVTVKTAAGTALEHGADGVLLLDFPKAADGDLFLDFPKAADGDLFLDSPKAADGDLLLSYSISPGICSGILAAAVKVKEPMLCLFPLNAMMREIAARTAFMCHAGLIADCLELKYEKNEIIAVSPSHGGEIMAELGFSDASKTGFITVQPNAFNRKGQFNPPGKKNILKTHCRIPAITDHEKDMGIFTVKKGEAARSRPIETLRVELDGNFLNRESKISLISRKKETPLPSSLEFAPRVVAGGAGLGNIEGFRNLRKLAAALGATVGATRPPVLWHWTDEDSLIGQTGKSIRPELLVTVGTSGAVQYTAGITGAKTIVAVNKDPGAAIFKFADIGVVEDAAVFLPLFTQKIQKIAMRLLADSIGSEEGQGGEPGEQCGGDGHIQDKLLHGGGIREADFGSRLMQMRSAHGISLDELAQKTGRTPDFIEELENNRTTPSVGFMIQLAEIFGVDPEIFLNDGEQAALSESRSKEYTRRAGNYFYQSLTPGAENEHLRVFMVTIESSKKHKPVAYRHEGEEFIYVMDGILELTLEGKSHKLMPGESIKFNSQTPHQLKSSGTRDTRCLVTLYTP
ncbi:MAG: cupin domain-containing protein [Desulfamplus sp.]|nr:cupin domain-containing protein [Desulfamplus sp.]